MKISSGPVLALALSAAALIAPAHAGTTTSGKLDPAASARAKAKVAQFLDWERQVKPSGLYQSDLGGALPTIVSPELLCLLNAASKAREIATREAPDEKPPLSRATPSCPTPGITCWARRSSRRAPSPAAGIAARSRCASPLASRAPRSTPPAAPTVLSAPIWYWTGRKAPASPISTLAAAVISANPAACAPPSMRRSPPIPPQGESSARGWGNRVLA